MFLDFGNKYQTDKNHLSESGLGFQCKVQFIDL